MAEIRMMDYGTELVNYIVRGEFTDEMNQDDFKKTVREEIQKVAEANPIGDESVEVWCHSIMASVAHNLGFDKGNMSLIRKFYLKNCADSSYTLSDFEPMDAMWLLVAICDGDYDVERVSDDLCQPLIETAQAVIENEND